MVHVRPGFRLLTINSNYCARLNPWQLYDPIDPGHQLKWLAGELFEAEKAGDVVHIIGHVPPDHRECTQSWLYNYIRIIERFQNIIKAQYYGHTHRDEFRIIYGLKEPKNPIGFELISPSITSYSQTNPAYRIYTIDDKTFEIIEHETYFFNLTDTNTGGKVKPEWKLEYKSSEALGFTPLNPVNFHSLLNKLNNDPLEFEKYYRRYYVMAEVDIAKVLDLSRRGMILEDHQVRDPNIVLPTSIIPAS